MLGVIYSNSLFI